MDCLTEELEEFESIIGSKRKEWVHEKLKITEDLFRKAHQRLLDNINNIEVLELPKKSRD